MSPGPGWRRRTLRERDRLTRETKARRSPWPAAPLPAGRCLQGEQCAPHRSPAPAGDAGPLAAVPPPGGNRPISPAQLSPPPPGGAARAGGQAPRLEKGQPPAANCRRGRGRRSRGTAACSSERRRGPSAPLRPLPRRYLHRGAPLTRQLEPGPRQRRDGHGPPRMRGTEGSGAGQWAAPGRPRGRAGARSRGELVAVDPSRAAAPPLFPPVAPPGPPGPARGSGNPRLTACRWGAGGVWPSVSLSAAGPGGARRRGGGRQKRPRPPV
ncbi:uncharacterized protein LOC142061972 [Phalacrocorax aristotelis]|uniref:uncharacterized protein LOC142061972 n=1 Tax=Phalacrocorax aristotelis TaxID=126867 RepID=UPI003F4BAF16